MTMAFEGMMLQGIIVGIVGIVLLLCLIPMCFGWKNTNKQRLASIEAARAGTSGAGFAVVADEMRQLSNTSSVFSEQVSEVVKGLMKEVGETAGQQRKSGKYNL